MDSKTSIMDEPKQKQRKLIAECSLKLSSQCDFSGTGLLWRFQNPTPWSAASRTTQTPRTSPSPRRTATTATTPDSFTDSRSFDRNWRRNRKIFLRHRKKENFGVWKFPARFSSRAWTRSWTSYRWDLLLSFQAHRKILLFCEHFITTPQTYSIRGPKKTKLCCGPCWSDLLNKCYIW